MTTSEVSRNLSAVLDEAERGETIAVARNGDRVALIVPAPLPGVEARVVPTP